MTDDTWHPETGAEHRQRATNWLAEMNRRHTERGTAAEQQHAMNDELRRQHRNRVDARNNGASAGGLSHLFPMTARPAPEPPAVEADPGAGDEAPPEDMNATLRRLLQARKAGSRITFRTPDDNQPPTAA
jgi:hypothetical protein